jgi:hypothetical protein
MAGWVLTIAGALFILAGVIANMHIYFQPTSLFNTPVTLINADPFRWWTRTDRVCAKCTSDEIE